MFTVTVIVNTNLLNSKVHKMTVLSVFFNEHTHTHITIMHAVVFLVAC